MNKNVNDVLDEASNEFDDAEQLKAFRMLPSFSKQASNKFINTLVRKIHLSEISRSLRGNDTQKYL